MGPLLFYLIMYKIIEQLDVIDEYYRMGQGEIAATGYAYDIVLLAESNCKKY